jgi:mycothiol synthase
MNNSLYIIRNYRPTDFDKYVQLIVEAEKLEPTGRCVSPEVLSESLYRPNYSPEQDLFVVETAGNIVGYVDVEPELLVGRVILNCFIQPDHRRRGLATELLGYATHRAKELGVKVAHVNIAQGNVAAKSVLSKLGFRFVRRFLQLRLDMAKIRGQDIDQAALQCRHLQPGEEDKLTQIQNRSFTGTWGFNPNSVEEISYRTNLSRCSPEDVMLACDGDKVISYCWTRTIYEAGTNERKGQILMLGVDPDYRGRGIGKGVLLAGLSYLKSKGFQVAELTVDSRNKEACSLYRSIGFKVWASTLWYEKAIG